MNLRARSALVALLLAVVSLLTLGALGPAGADHAKDSPWDLRGGNPSLGVPFSQLR